MSSPGGSGEMCNPCVWIFVESMRRIPLVEPDVETFSGLREAIWALHCVLCESQCGVLRSIRWRLNKGGSGLCAFAKSQREHYKASQSPHFRLSRISGSCRALASGDQRWPRWAGESAQRLTPTPHSETSIIGNLLCFISCVSADTMCNVQYSGNGNSSSYEDVRLGRAGPKAPTSGGCL
eukprot:6198721-Pleurochrysis_carterae.AAC.1